MDPAAGPVQPTASATPAPDDAQARAVADQARLLGSEERRRFLNERCGHDEGFRAKVEVLLARDLFERLPPDLTAQDANIGRRIGPYRIERLIAGGGMGRVYLAARADHFDQKVAVKLIKRGMDTDEIGPRRAAHHRQRHLRPGADPVRTPDRHAAVRDRDEIVPRDRAQGLPVGAAAAERRGGPGHRRGPGRRRAAPRRTWRASSGRDDHRRHMRHPRNRPGPGQARHASRAEQRAIRLLPDGDPRRTALQARLDLYRAAAASQPATHPR